MKSDSLWGFLVICGTFFFMGFMIAITVDFLDENSFSCVAPPVIKEIEPNVYQFTVRCEAGK